MSTGNDERWPEPAPEPESEPDEPWARREREEPDAAP
jgi:hypothetical protein